MALTDAKIRALKPRPKRYKVSDSSGLQLHVMPSGAKSWRVAYRFLGKQKSLTLGPYPEIGLGDARKQCAETHERIRKGEDPAFEKQKQKAAMVTAYGNLFRDVGKEYLDRMVAEGKATATLNKNTWLLKNHAYPFIGDRPIEMLSVHDVLTVLRRLEKAGKYNTAIRLRAFIGQILRYCVATGRAPRDFTPDLRGALIAPAPKHHAAILEERSIGPLMRAIWEQPSTIYALRLAPFVFVRPVELRHAEWTEIDIEKAIWRIPAEKLKMRRPHLVPLPRQAIEIIQEARQFSGKGKYLFPSVRTLSRPISNMTINAALRRLGYGTEEMSGHGFRRMASTILNEAGFKPDWIERQLAHIGTDRIRNIYNAAEYLEGRTTMMQWWADKLMQLKDEKSIKS